jgi:hypothetical protein
MSIQCNLFGHGHEVILSTWDGSKYPTDEFNCNAVYRCPRCGRIFDNRLKKTPLPPEFLNDDVPRSKVEEWEKNNL